MVRIEKRYLGHRIDNGRLHIRVNNRRDVARTFVIDLYALDKDISQEKVKNNGQKFLW